MHISREREEEGGREAYQCDDGGTCAGEGDDVEVVGQVELWEQRAEVSRGDGEIKEERKGRSTHLAGVADLSQCGPASFARRGIPGNNACGIREMKHHRGCLLSHRRQEAFSLPRDCMIEGIMN